VEEEVTRIAKEYKANGTIKRDDWDVIDMFIFFTEEKAKKQIDLHQLYEEVPDRIEVV
jgi:hypothetical protein